MLLKYDDGALAVLTCALRTDAESNAEIMGTDGRIEVHAPFNLATKITLHKPDSEDVVLELPIEGNGLNYEAAETMRCMRAGLLESPLMPLDESLEIMRTMDAIRQPWGLVYKNDLTGGN